LLPTPKPLVKLGKPFIELLEVDSTNNYAHNLIKQNLATNGIAIFAHKQTNGKGQIGKEWIAKFGENILLSVIIDISTVHLQNQFPLVAIAALSCHGFFKKYAGKGTVIKWSNDIYFNDNKAGGILIETVNWDNKRFAIVGMGININQIEFDKNLVNPISLKQITGNNYKVLDLANELHNKLMGYYKWLMDEKFDHLLKKYNTALYKKNKQATLKKGNIKFTCTIKRINAFGELEVANGLKDTFSFGEVQWIN
jgi:BirA family biotin operon repressor/biotin-[acetyl-CoA-carboxylase] ligase